MNSHMLSRRLERLGLEVKLARTGRKGIDMAISMQPDLILMDMSRPEIDGWTATRMLRENPATAKIGIIALTAHAMSGDREKYWTRVAMPLKPSRWILHGSARKSSN